MNQPSESGEQPSESSKQDKWISKVNHTNKVSQVNQAGCKENNFWRLPFGQVLVQFTPSHRNKLPILAIQPWAADFHIFKLLTTIIRHHFAKSCLLQCTVHTCSVSKSNALSNIWLPSNEVTAIKRNKPSSTEVGIRVSGVGNISRDKAIRVLESKPDNLVSLTLTILKMEIWSSVSFNILCLAVKHYVCINPVGEITIVKQSIPKNKTRALQKVISR